MNDIITAATSGLFVEVGKVIEHMKAQQSRIAALEEELRHKNEAANQCINAALAKASAPAVERQKPLAWLRKWAFDGETPRKEKGKWVAKFRFLPITQHRAFNDDVPLYTAPQAADTDKVREDWRKFVDQWMGDWDVVIPTDGYEELLTAPFPAASMAAQAPVREVPEGWVACSDRLPELYQTVALLNEDRWMNTGNDDFNTNWHGAGWLAEFGQKFWSVIGETRSMTLESVTHWLPLPAAPVQQEGE